MPDEKTTRRGFLRRATLTAAALVNPLRTAAAADTLSRRYPVGPLESVAALRQRAEWKQFTIFVWQYENDVRRDAALYQKAGLRGFHIDGGAGEQDKIQFSLDKSWPYYVDHAAGKGILYLPKDVQQKISRVSGLQIRPSSLADPRSIDQLKALLRENVGATKRGLVYAYAFDDEISLGAFNNPVEVDIHPESLAWYRIWLGRRYGAILKLNDAWGTQFPSFDAVDAISFENMRGAANRAPLAAWNLSRWFEWRHFMDFQFAQVLAELTRHTNSLDPAIPAGFVGGQQPSAYGGFDYALLARAVQWMEAADFGGTNEIIRSFWNRPRRPHVQTFNGASSLQGNTWTLWHRLCHGQQATIAWPGNWFTGSEARSLAPHIEQLAPVFREVQGSASGFILHPDSYLDADPIGIYYSHPSIRASWVMDCVTHGSSWPNRSTSIDDANLSSARLRFAWCKLLEDLGYQYDFISYLDVQEERVQLSKRFKIVILPQAICLSDREAQALRAYVRAGGTLIADSLCGLLSETGRGRKIAALDDLFGIKRDESLGYLNGKGITEIDAEQYQRPFQERLESYRGALQFNSMIVHERGTRSVSDATGETVQSAHVMMRRKIESGRTVYLNLTPIAYSEFSFRSGAMGRSWRDVIGKALIDAGITPRIEITGANGGEPWMEALFWRNGERYTLAILKNAPELFAARDADAAGEQEITVRLRFPARDLRNVRTGKKFAAAQSFTDRFVPWEANLYEFSSRG